MEVTVVGAGIAGAACAAALRARGVQVRMVDRGRAPGGRMASPELHGRRVDTGAQYFTASDPAFLAQVDAWERDGLARRWTDTFGIVEDGEWSTTTGPMRWAAPQGLRSLVAHVLGDTEVETAELTELPEGDVVLAMPDPQAARLVDLGNAVDYEPVVAVVCGFAERSWSFEHAAFVNGHPLVTFIADDGDRRGDGAPVLVAHAKADEGVPEALSELLGTPEPEWVHTHRWGFAKPAGKHDAPFALDGRLGRAGDQYCPDGEPRVESAWLSGTLLAGALLGR